MHIIDTLDNYLERFLQAKAAKKLASIYL